MRMRILIADDDPVSRRVLEATLVKAGYEVAVAGDGLEAVRALQRDDPPPLAILDWMMPGVDGVEVCRTVRKKRTPTPPYLILLTARGRSEDIVAGLRGGADDYLTKPFDGEELRARVEVGARVVTLQQGLADRMRALEDALARVKQLQGLLPICAWCKKVRNDQNYWQTVEGYVTEHTEARFSHSICPECREKYVTPEIRRRLEDAP